MPIALSEFEHCYIRNQPVAKKNLKKVAKLALKVIKSSKIPFKTLSLLPNAFEHKYYTAGSACSKTA